MAPKNKIVIPVGFSFDDLSGNLNKVASVLNNLKIDSNITKQVKSAVEQAERQLKGLEKFRERGVSSYSDVDAMNRGLDAYERAIKKIQTAMQGVKFKDLVIPTETLNEINTINGKIAELKSNLDHLRQNNFKNFLSGTDGWADKITEVTGLTKDEITTVKKLKDALDSQQTSAQASTDELERQKTTLKETIDIMDDFKKLSDEFAVEDKARGGLKFASGQGKMGSEARNQLLDLANQYGANELSKIIQTGSFREIQEAFENFFKFKPPDELKTALEDVGKQIEELKQKSSLIDQIREALKKALKAGDPEAMTMEIEQLEQELAKVKQQAEQTGREQAFKGLSTSAKEAENSINDTRSAVDILKSTLQTRMTAENILSNVTSRLTQLIGLDAVMRQVGRGIRTAVDQIRELDAAMNGIAVVTDFTTAELWGQIDAYMAMAKQYGVTTTGTYQVSQLYYQMGLSTNEVMSLTTETLKMAKIAGLDYAEATDYMTVA